MEIANKEAALDEYTITKSQVECYKLRHKSGMYWADITVDHNENTGRIQIASDYGDYQYYWGACGCPFKQFLIKVGKDYAGGKFGASKWFDFDATIKNYKRDVIEMRRSEYFDQKKARNIFDEIKQLAEQGSSNEINFIAEIQEKNHLMEYYNWSPDLSHDLSPQFRKFWDGPWQAFIETLKSETNE